MSYTSHIIITHVYLNSYKHAYIKNELVKTIVSGIVKSYEIIHETVLVYFRMTLNT